MKTIKEFKKEIKECPRTKGIIAYRRDMSFGGMYPTDTPIEKEYQIAEVIGREGDILIVDNIKEIEYIAKALTQLDDVAKCSYDYKRLDAFYKNGKRALTIYTRRATCI